MTTINNQEDLLRALSGNPAWRAAVRAQILGDDLLQLPARFDVFAVDVTARLGRVEETQRMLAETQVVMQETLAGVLEMQRIMEVRLNHIDSVQQTTANQIGGFKGFFAQNLAARQAAVIAHDMGMQYVNTVPYSDLISMARRTPSTIPANKLRSFYKADLIIEATDNDALTYIAVEASFTGDERDTRRALRNARYLEQFTGHPARAAIASVSNDYRIESLIEDKTVYWYELDEWEFFSE